jgi:hypothetical protein
MDQKIENNFDPDMIFYTPIESPHLYTILTIFKVILCSKNPKNLH